jgi:hypothetical protein
LKLIPVMLAAALAVAGCGQAGTSSSAGQPSSASVGPFGGKIPVGTQLGSLLTDARLPAGWGPVTDAGRPEIDTGSLPQSPTGPQSGQDSCPTLGLSVQAGSFTQWWRQSQATIIIQNNRAPASLSAPVVDLTIAAYQPAANAARTLSTVAALASSCKSFTDSSGDSVTVTSAAVPQIGTEGLYLSSTVRTSNAGPIVSQVLLAQVGIYVIGVDTNTATGGNVSQATVEQMGTWLASLVSSKS